MLKHFIILTICLCPIFCYAQDSTFIKVHFLYGSKPLKTYKDVEPKWFGGILGGHAGIEGDRGKVLSFVPRGKFHWLATKHNRHSAYAIHSVPAFYSILGGNPDSAKKTVVYIPVTNHQKQVFDSLCNSYLQQTPYDYALLGMRCGAATYEILGQLDILPHYGYTRTYLKIFYPKKLRKKLLKKARKNGWLIEQTEGSPRRKWEQD